MLAAKRAHDELKFLGICAGLLSVPDVLPIPG
jgi:hypothetical protein